MITTTDCDRSIAEGVAIRQSPPDGLSNQGSPVGHLAQRTRRGAVVLTKPRSGVNLLAYDDCDGCPHTLKVANLRQAE